MALHNQNPNFTKSENSTISSADSISKHHLINNIIIAIFSVSSAVLFLVITYYTVLIRRRTRRSDFPAGENGVSSDFEHGEADYHVWHVRTVGLEESAINSIPAKPYAAGSGAAADCSVCLGDFCDGELVRFLPACGHAFHVLCIDTWLRAHVSCPLCRADIGDTDVGELLDGFEENDDVDDGDMDLDCVESSAIGDESRFDLVDSFLENDLSFGCDCEERLEDGDVLNGVKQASGSIEERQEKKGVDSGGGSSSGSGKIFFFARYGRSRSSPVLPT